MTDTPDLVCFDLPSLVTVRPGVAEEAVDRALRRVDVEPGSDLHAHVTSLGLRWPGQAAAAALVRALGSPAWADAAAAAFDDAFGAAVARRGLDVAPGAVACVAQLRGLGNRVCITTEFSACTREAVLDVLDWQGLVAMLLSAPPSGEALIVSAVDRAGVEPAHAVVVAGSLTAMTAGARAGVGTVIGVPSHDTTARQLRAAGATIVSTLPELATAWSGARLVSA